MNLCTEAEQGSAAGQPTDCEQEPEVLGSTIEREPTVLVPAVEYVDATPTLPMTGENVGLFLALALVAIITGAYLVFQRKFAQG